VSGIDHFGLMSNMFTATERWYDANPDLVEAWLELWQQGIDLWNRNVEEIVGIYPQHFAVETEEDIEFVIDYLGANDWFVDDVTLTTHWIDGEVQVYEFMKETGFMDLGEEVPRFEAVGIDG
ncbi:MAG TPA: hypothetical protein VK891_16315, partial [Euzebyales bacterium]|nr:hypothetical protein [Euzebyales bacterium]